MGPPPVIKLSLTYPPRRSQCLFVTVLFICHSFGDTAPVAARVAQQGPRRAPSEKAHIRFFIPDCTIDV
jgi:hypothetical protein